MKRIAYSLLTALALTVPAQAIVGGPFDNNLFYTPNVAGTYQGTISGKNISGVMIFGTSASSVAGNGSASGWIGSYGSDGRIVTFIEGEMIVGQVTSTVNVADRNVSGVFAGSVLRGYQSWGYVVNISPTENQIMQYTLRDVLNVSGDFEGKFDKTYPSLTYAGKANVEIRSVDGVDEVVNAGVPRYVATIKLEKVKAQVRGVRTSSQQPFFATNIPPVEVPGVVGGSVDND